jgi:hypothetical protein
VNSGKILETFFTLEITKSSTSIANVKENMKITSLARVNVKNPTTKKAF